MVDSLFPGISGLASPGITIAPTGSFRVTVEVRNPGTQRTNYRLVVTMLKAPSEYQLGTTNFALDGGKMRTLSYDFSPIAAGLPAFPRGTYGIFVDLGPAIPPLIPIYSTRALPGEVTVA